jgi:signal transduction histidine kinase
MAVVSQIGRDALSNLPPGEALHKIISAIWSLLPEVRSVAILLKEGESLVCAAVGGESGQLMQGQRLPLDTPMLAPVLQGGRPICVRNSYRSRVRFKHPTGPLSFPNQTVLATPLKVLDNTLGCIIATYAGAVPTVDEDLYLLDFTASWAAISLTNARLVQDLQNSLKQEKSMRAQLAKADRLATIGMITASVTHEINNPIQAVLGCLELVQMDALDLEKQHEYLEMAKQELLRLASITKRVLNYQRSSQQPTSEPVELPMVVEDVLALVRKKLQHAKIVINTDYPACVPIIMGSPNELKQVFLNMILNAIDAMGKGGRLNVSLRVVEQDGRWVQVIFNDSGEGIPPETLKLLYEPFFSTKETGTGLGLWVSRDIIGAHNGKIDIDSKVGAGTTFTIWLPF